MGHSGNGRSVYVGDHSPGKTKERLPSSLGGGLEPLLYDSMSCIFAEAGKAVPGVTARQTQPTQAGTCAQPSKGRRSLYSEPGRRRSLGSKMNTKLMWSVP